MTPKEKAKVILHKHLYWYPPIEGMDEQLHKSKAIGSAIITVDEIIQDYSSYRIKPWVSYNNALELMSYWEEVKSEIEKL
jgi:hypothetical protein